MYKKLCIKPNDKILVVAPHPDDESIGVGGLLCKYGPQCDLLLLTDGSKGVSPKEERTGEEIASLRNKEFENAVSYFGANKITKLDIEDQTVYKNKKRVYSYSIKEYDFVFVPNRFDGHIDHKVLRKIFGKMKYRQRAKAEIIEYELWSTFSKPNLFLDITDVMDKKLGAVSMYASQLESYDYIGLCEGISKYRGAINHVKYGESYYSGRVGKKQDREKMLMWFWQRTPRRVRNFIKKIR